MIDALLRKSPATIEAYYCDVGPAHGMSNCMAIAHSLRRYPQPPDGAGIGAEPHCLAPLVIIHVPHRAAARGDRRDRNTCAVLVSNPTIRFGDTPVSTTHIRS